jgi:hypothetical protein
LEWFKASFIPCKTILIRSKKKYSFIYNYYGKSHCFPCSSSPYCGNIFSNGYNVEGASRGNQHKKDDDIYKTQKFIGQYNDADCLNLFLMCSVFYYLIPLFNQRCTPNYHTSNYIAPNSSDAPSLPWPLIICVAMTCVCYIYISIFYDSTMIMSCE